MKQKNWDFLLYIHGVLLLWVVLFIASLFIDDGGQIASILAVGNALFLFVNIPLSILCLVLNKKNYFHHHKAFAIILSAINMLISIIMWIFVVMLMQMP